MPVSDIVSVEGGSFSNRRARLATSGRSVGVKRVAARRAGDSPLSSSETRGTDHCFQQMTYRDALALNVVGTKGGLHMDDRADGDRSLCYMLKRCYVSRGRQVHTAKSIQQVYAYTHAWMLPHGRWSSIAQPNVWQSQSASRQRPHLLM